MERDAVLYRPFDAAGLVHFSVAKLFNTGRIQNLEILKRIAIDDDQIGFVPNANTTDLVFLTKNLGIVTRHMLNDLERVKTRFLVKLELADQAKAIHLINKSCIFPCADQAAATLEFEQCAHPDAVILFPECFISRGPADKI